MTTTTTTCPRCHHPETPDHLSAWEGLCQTCWGELAEANLTDEDREWLERN